MHTDREISETVVKTNLHEIKEIRFLTDEAFVIRLDRGNLEFKAGQHIIVGQEGEINLREYSVYSGENDDYLEILVREVKGGNVSLKLKDNKPGQLLQVNGPFGSFGPEKPDMYSRRHVFISTGTGISPFHSIVRSYPGIDYALIHGVRYRNEAYEKEDFDPHRYILCTSKESIGGKKGRVTRFFSGYHVDPDMLFFLCGNSSMIYEVRHILGDKGIPDNNIFTEIYF